LYDYAADGQDELSISIGEVLTVVAPESNGWMFGTNAKGETGMFPASYVEKL